jgi:ABC-type uncharacterized transport system ATPase subunit
VLVMDEPTAVLAPAEIDGLLPRCAHGRRKSVIFISHKLQK